MHPNRPRVRYAIYTRQSAAPEGTLSSCEVQFEACQEFAEARSGSAWEWVGSRFDDLGESGANTQRPAFQEFIEQVQAGVIQKIITYRLDRLTRNLQDSLEILKICRQNDVELLIVTAPDLGAAATDKFLINILATFAEFEREIIGSRIADKREFLKKQGRRIAGVVPFGFETDADKQLISNHEEAQKVETFFQLAADGMLPRGISEKANDLGWKTRATDSKSGQKRGGNAWRPRQILSLLRNPVYVGLFSDKDDVRKGRHRPLVSAELFQRVQVQIDARCPERRTRHSDPYGWPLRGKLLCSQCGRIMSSHYSQRGNIRYPHIDVEVMLAVALPAKVLLFRLIKSKGQWSIQSTASTSRITKTCRPVPIISWSVLVSSGRCSIRISSDTSFPRSLSVFSSTRRIRICR